MAKSTKKQRCGVLICGAYGMGNAGDEAVLEGILAALRPLCPDITVLSRRPEQTARRHGVAAIASRRVLRWLAAMRRGALFISGGGSLLQNVTSRRSLWFYLMTIRAAKKMGCAVQLYGCGIGPVSGRRDRLRTARTLNRCADAITLRDADSLALLRALGVTRPRLSLTADPTLALPPARGERRRRAVFALRGWEGFWARVPDLAACARYVYETYRLTPVFLCMAPDDRTAARCVQESLGPDVPASVTADIREIGRASLVVSIRLHGLILALRDGTPACGLSYDPKVSSFCEQAHLPWLPLDGAEEPALRRLVDEALRLDAETLSETARMLRERERGNIETAARLLEEAER